MPRTSKRGGGSFLPDANGHASATGGGKPHDSDLLSNTDILYLKNVVLKFIQVQHPVHTRLLPLSQHLDGSCTSTIRPPSYPDPVQTRQVTHTFT